MKKIIILAAIIGLALTLSMPLHAQAQGESLAFMVSGVGTVSGDIVKDVDQFSLAAVYRTNRPGTIALARHGGHLKIGTDVNCNVIVGGLSIGAGCKDEQFNFRCVDPSTRASYSVRVNTGKDSISVTYKMTTIIYDLVEGFIDCREAGP
jgi:hypothetical protein